VDEDLRWLISVDDHLMEPPHLWVDRAAAKDRDRVPHVERIDGFDTWVYEDAHTPVYGIHVAARKTPAEFSPLPVNYDEMPEAYYEPKARVRDMDADHVIAAMNFPLFPRFCGQLFAEAQDKELALKCLQDYNDFIIDEWCASAPGRFIPMTLIPLWDVDLACAEALRCAGKGAKAIAFSENLHPLGLPSIHSGAWDKFFAVADETGMPLCTHIGSSSMPPVTSPDAPFGVVAVNINLNLAHSTTDWLFSGKLQKFPNLKICLSEGDIGWIPWLLQRADHVARNYQYLRGKNWGFDPANGQMFEIPTDPANFPESPTQLFRDHMYGCFIEDPVGTASLEIIGYDNVMVETDYPHTDTLWPNSVAVVDKMLEGVSDENKYKILQGNARRVFDFEPAPYPSLV
jgi:predicted TIM-barrel fold metal-dependent hydrolase